MKKTFLNGSFEYTGGAVKKLKEQGVTDEGSMEIPKKSKKKTDSNRHSEGNGVAVKDS